MMMYSMNWFTMRSSYLSYEYSDSDTGCCSSDQDQGSDLATSSNIPGLSQGLRSLPMLIDSAIFETKQPYSRPMHLRSKLLR